MATYEWKTDKRGNRHFVRTANAVAPVKAKAKPKAKKAK